MFDDDNETCNICGLSKDLCICGEVAKNDARIKVVLEKRKWGKIYTVISGLDPKEFNLKEIAITLKSKLACGGTVKGNNIELQGNHEFRIIDILEYIGFDKNSIDIIRN